MELPSKEELAKIVNQDKRTIEGKLKKILEAGVPLTLAESSEPLPILTIDRSILEAEEDEKPEIIPDCPDSELQSMASPSTTDAIDN